MIRHTYPQSFQLYLSLYYLYQLFILYMIDLYYVRVALQVSLLDYNAKHAQFKLLPRYKVKSEGEFVSNSFVFQPHFVLLLPRIDL